MPQPKPARAVRRLSVFLTHSELMALHQLALKRQTSMTKLVSGWIAAKLKREAE